MTFDPATLFAAGEQGYWLDPSDFSTMFQDTARATPVTAVGQSVRRMLDKSGRGNTFTQANTANAPILRQDASGRYFLLFDGVDDWLRSANTINPGAVDKAQVFAGVRKLSTGLGVITEASADTANNNGTFGLLTQNGTAYQYAFGSRGSVASSAFTNDPSFAAPVTTVLTGTADISGNVVRLRANGSQVAQATSGQGTGNYLTHTHFIGRRNGTSLPFNGRLYQLIARYGANLSAGQITQTETFVNARTGAF